MKNVFKQFYFSIIPFLGLLVLFCFENASKNIDGSCSIDDLVLKYTSGCDNNNTVATFADDTFTINVEICYTSRPSVGTLDFSNTYIDGGIYSVNVNTLPLADTCVEVWNIPMMATEDIEDIYLTASFSAESSCSLTKYIGETREQCSLCDTNESQSSYPSCWPSQNVTGVCDESESFAPDVDYPEHTPIRYMKTVLHIFQQEDPDSLGQWKIHPTDPRNFTKADTNFFRSWFSSSGGANDFLQNLCDDTTDFSPHMRDARLQLLNHGIDGVDLFFHPDNQGWGMGSVHCGGGNTGYAGTARSKYVISPSPSNPYYDVLKEDSTENAFHIFITGGVWVDQPPGDPAIPDDDDCYWLCGGGFTTGMVSCSNSVTQYPYSVLQGTYQVWLSGQGQGQGTNGTGDGGDCSTDYMNSGSDAGMGKGLLGEIFHVLTVDHTSPFQAHVNHNNYYDSCEDTPATSLYNWMDCYQDTRCALTQCQIGRIHRFFEERKPEFERFPDGQGSFTRTLPCESTLEDIIIPNGADITWAGPRTLRSGIVVESGGKLTINCDVGMPTDASIKVEGGGKLYINGAKIFSYCEEETWAGIIVEGTTNNQFPLSTNGQGLLSINSGSTIESADQITVSHGALLWASGADFINCGLITFHDYHKNSYSRFIGCDFLRQDSFVNYYSFNDWPDQVLIDNMNRLFFLSCDFETIQPEGLLYNGTAINSIGSKFEVTSTSISDYHTGVNGSPLGISSFAGFTVKQCTLANNQIGISSLGANNLIIRDNVITGIGNYNSTSAHVGICLESGTAFEVTDNQFEGGTGNDNNYYGIIALNTGDESNIIEHNSFKDLYAANQADGTNNGILPFQGLQYQCNDNISGNDYDFLVFEGGIAGNQGNNTLASGNTFSLSTVEFGDFRNESNRPINYFYYDTTNQVPTNYDTIDVPVIPFNVNFVNSCSDGSHDYPINSELFLIIKNRLDSLRSGYDSLLTVYLGLLNGGYSESSLKSIVDNATSGTASTILTQLLSASPYLTVEVLKAVSQRTDIYTNNEIKQVLEANPDELRSPSLQDFLYTEFTQAFVDSVLLQQTQQTVRTDREAQLGDYKLELHLAANQLIKHELADTTSIDFTAYRTWLYQKESPSASYERALSYMIMGDTVRARQVQDSIPILFDLTTAQDTEHDYFEDLLDIIIDTYSNDINHRDYDTTTVANLEDIADNSIGLSGAMTRNLLNIFYGYNYVFTPQTIVEKRQSNLPPPGDKYKKTKLYQPVLFVPNPASSQVVVQYHFQKPGDDPAILKAYDINGRMVSQHQLNGQTGRFQWNVSKLERGVYYCVIERGMTLFEPQKLVLID